MASCKQDFENLKQLADSLDHCKLERKLQEMQRRWDDHDKQQVSDTLFEHYPG